MLLNNVWDLVEEKIFNRPSTEYLFNPYLDQEADLDCVDAPSIRRQNFKNYLAAYQRQPRLFLLAEAPGPWGCRFSGVPLVSESQLVDESFPIHGKATSLNETPHTEYTARIYWRVLGAWFPHFFTWNTVPFHPYKPDNRLSIRTPKRQEILSFVDVIESLVDALQPEKVLAIGRKAESALTELQIPCHYIRHPSQGGAKKFEEGVLAVLRGLEISPSQP